MFKLSKLPAPFGSPQTMAAPLKRQGPEDCAYCSRGTPLLLRMRQNKRGFGKMYVIDTVAMHENPTIEAWLEGAPRVARVLSQKEIAVP